jgi:CHASE2 domain-containing sensor protein
MAIGLGCLAAVVGIFGSVVRAPWVKLLEMLEALGFVGVGGFILATRGNLFGPALPIVLIVIGAIQGIIAFREYRKQHAR